MTSVKEVSFPSATGCGTIVARAYLPDKKPRALLQIVHGMAEHAGRYDAFCRFMSDHDLAVCLHDQAGHGKSAAKDDDLGYFGSGDNLDALLEDIQQMKKETLTLLGDDVPVVLLGHSMGSFLARLLCTRQDPDLAGVIFSGTRGPDALVAMGCLLARRSVRKHGPRHRDEKLAKLTARGQLRKIKHPKSSLDWLTRDEKIVAEYEADPRCGFTFTAAGYADLYRMIRLANRRAWFRKMPDDFPILLFSGTHDPIGQYGRGPRRVCQRLKKKGRRVSLFLYHQGRHEMLNETNRHVVWQDILAWLRLLEGVDLDAADERRKKR